MTAMDTSRLHWEDVEVGRTLAYGAYPVTREEIFAYARAYDPGPHHVDEEAAGRSPSHEPCASEWHACAIFMRMFYDGVLANAASLGGPAIDEVRWLQPVRPGHVLSARSTCVEKRLMRSRPGVGICRMRHEMLSQDGELLMTMANPFFIAVRDAAGARSEAGR